MNESNHNDTDPIEMMMKAVDGLLSPDELQRWEETLASDPKLVSEFLKINASANYMNSYRERQLYARHANTSTSPHRLMRLGMGCLLAGLCVLVASTVTSTMLEGMIGGVALMVIGGGLLLKAQSASSA